MNIEHFRKLLRAKESDLTKDTARLSGEARAAGEQEVGDATDAAASDQAAAETLQLDTMESETLTMVREALQKIEAGTYGKCLECDRQIEPARLEAVPWARYCLADQEKQDTITS